ncbi:hypothetical protein EGW08_002943 [Elysia chlorotica]|uniref:Ubinuclein middle domain-containing protein n=1 Tax=Elysia chlorotica TaxID=188477 RepID=A0A3S0ZYK4_ELYCH|nr:hypothetical protein EGW08_002943 [Elysia chlorotica]
MKCVENGSKPEIDSEGKNGAVLQEAIKDESSSKSGDEGRGEQQSAEKLIPLPAQLPADMVNSIERLKKCAKENTEGKCKFFSPEINKLLLEIEVGSYSLAWGSRTAIFGHLGDHLPCNKPALLRRAKKLHETQEEDQMKEPMQRLKKAIDAVMPAQQEKYKQLLLKAKADAETNSNTDGPKNEASVESEEDEAKQGTTSKKFKRPKQQFKWTSETRQFLGTIVTLKMKSYKVFKSRNQTAEDYIKTFLENDVRRLWPDGWMQTRVLLKESRMFHKDLAKPVSDKSNKDTVVASSAKSLPAVSGADTSVSPAAAAASRVSKNVIEDVIEISNQSKEEAERSSKESGSRGDTIVVDLPGSSPTTVSNARPSGPSSTVRKLSPPPVEVIDIKESPVKPPSSQPGITQSLLVSDKVPISQKQGQPFKPVSKLQMHPSNQWAHQGQSQPSQKISTVGGLSLSQPTASQPRSGDVSPHWGNKIDSMYQAKVVLKPVSVSQGQQIKAVGNISSKSGNLQQGQAKSSHISSSAPQPGLLKPPVSFSTSSVVSSAPGQGAQNNSIGSSKLYPQPPQLHKPQAAASSGNPSVLPLAGSLPRNMNPQIRSGVILGTSSSHPNACFPYTQSGGKTSNLISYRPQQTAVGVTPGHQSRPNQAALDCPGSSRPPHTLNVSPGSSKPVHNQAGRPAAVRTIPKSNTSSSLVSKSPVLIGSPVTSLTPPKRPYQPEQPSPPSRSNNSCSPQQLSPGEANAKLTLYEQIQSQIRSQEAMEGQALQNLALARNLMGFAGNSGSLSSK